MLYRVLTLWLILTVGIGLALLIGRQNPPSPQIAMLHLSECKPPCWIGIVPGKTTLSEARKRVKEVYGSITGYELTERSNGFDIISASDELLLSGNLDTVDGQAEEHIIHSVFLFSETPPMLGDLFPILGSPNYVWPLVELEVPSTVLFGAQAGVEARIVRLECSRIMPNKQVVSIGMYTPDVNYSDFLDWRGFGRCYD
jgi:hypothetical protein